MHKPSKNHPIPVAVYGTLRTGGRLHDFYLHGMTGHRCYIADHALMRSDVTFYPFLMQQLGEQAVAEVFWITDPQVLARMKFMEEQAGYTTEWVSVEDDNHVVQYDALAFVWKHDTAYGAPLLPVPGNDWMLTQEMEEA